MAPSSFPRPELKDLDLIKLVDWQGVGLQLGIEDYEFQKIKLNYQEHDDRKREMFRAWLRTCTNPNYHDLIKALEAKEVTSSKVNHQQTSTSFDTATNRDIWKKLVYLQLTSRSQ